MNKKVLLTAAAAAILVLGAGAARAEVSGNDNFYYHQEGNSVYVNLNGAMELGDRNGSEVIWGFYDGEKLIKTNIMQFDSLIQSFEMNETRIVLPYEPENLEVKAFVWSDDGKCTPAANAEEISSTPADNIECTTQVLAANMIKDKVMMYIPTDMGKELVSADVGNTDIVRHVDETVNIKLAYDGKNYTIVSYSVVENNIKKFPLNEITRDCLTDINDSVILKINDGEEDVISSGMLFYELDNLKSNNEYYGAEVTLIDTDGDGKYNEVKAEAYSKAEIAGIEKKTDVTKVSITGYTADIGSEYNVHEDSLCVYNINGQLLSINEAMVGDTVYIMNNDNNKMECMIIDSDRGFNTAVEEEEPLKVSDVSSSMYIINGENGAELYGSIEYDSEGTPEYLKAELTLMSDGGSDNVIVPLWSDADCITFNGGVVFGTDVSEAYVKLLNGDEEIFSAAVPVLGEKSEIVKAKGKIIGTPGNDDSLNSGEVSVLIDGNTYTMKTQLDIKTMYEYSEFMYTENNGEYTLKSIMPIFDERTHVITSDDILDDYKWDMISNQCIPIAANGNDPVGYELSSSVRLFVNGMEIYASDNNLRTYIAYNRGESIYLVDEVNPDSLGDGWGTVDYIFVEYYAEGVVDSVESNNNGSRIYLKQSSNEITASRIEWDTDFNGVHIFKDGKEIGLEDINVNDVLAVSYDINGSFYDSDYYNIYVNTQEISGTVVDLNREDNTVIIDGKEYKTARWSFVEEFDLNVKYHFYLNKNGYICYAEEDLSSINYGVVMGMYTAEDEDFATVQYLDKFGNSNEYKCVSEEQENIFYSIAMGYSDGNYMYYDGETITAADIMSRGIENSVFSYFVFNDRIEVREYLNARGEEEIEYSAMSNKIGSYLIDKEYTNLIYIDSSGSAVPVSYENLKHGGIYTAYAYDKAYTNGYMFIIITEGEFVEKPEIVNIDECSGVVTAIYKREVDEYARVDILNEDAELVSYQCKDNAEEDKFFTIYKGLDPADGVEEYNSKTYYSNYVTANGMNKSVCSYTVKDDKLELIDYLDGAGGDLIYNEADSKLGDYYVAEETTKLVNISDYDAGLENAVAIPVSALVDGSAYNVYLFKPDENGVYGYGIIFPVKSSIDSDTPISVVKSAPEKVTVDGKEYAQIEVCTYGMDGIYILFEDTEVQFNEGDIIVCAKDNKGVASDYEVVLRVDSGFYTFADRIYANDNFSDVIEPGVLSEGGGNSWKWNDDNGDQRVYFGPISQAQNNIINLILSKQNGVSNWKDIDEFTIFSGACSYLYDYSAKPDKGMRVYTGGIPTVSSNYLSYAEDMDGNILWDEVESNDIKPIFAFIRSDGYDIEDVVMYIPD